MKAMYTAEAKATGGRNGHVKSSNDVLDLVRSPKALRRK
jgi:organic hydroperoxide reductase OsmC/OhrA